MKQTKAEKKVGKVMGEFKEGKLKSSSGQKVTSRKQAVAIALSEAGKKKKYNEGGDVTREGLDNPESLKKQVVRLAMEYSRNPSKSVESDINELNNRLGPKERKEIKDQVQFFMRGGGGRDEYGTGIGGAFGARKQLDKNTFGEVYGEGFAYKPKGGKVEKDLTGYGARVTKTFAKGGSVAKKEKWIQEAIKKPGALRKTLKVKEGEKISEKELAKAAKAPGKTGQRARLAQTLKKMK